jgi:hypothetical protein
VDHPVTAPASAGQRDERERERQPAAEPEGAPASEPIEDDRERGQAQQRLDGRHGASHRVVERAGEREEAGVGALADHDDREQQRHRQRGLDSNISAATPATGSASTSTP